MPTRNTPDDGADGGTQRLKSLENTFAIVTELQARESAGVTELARATGLSKSSVYKHLATLASGDFVSKEGDEYRLGLRFLDIGAHVRSRRDGARVIRAKLREIAEETEETAQFSTMEHGRAVVLFRDTGRRGVLTKGRVGKRFYLHHTAGGKSILAQLPDERVHDIIETNGLPAATPNTITDPEELFDELETIRERGFAYNYEESTDGLRAVGVPLRGPDREVLGAFAVAAPTHRMRGDRLEREIPDLVQSVVNELELNLAHS
ncbi:IclR family transcriptional regulator [Halorarius litoreus]|uniref:IclR family transcriptional regulator n=1 Tax=Halorarius litoreus TaxID=2962676 RepID=UPI0020CFDEFB|nr:IclR family transcriptional regulator [Halorarius litoreus]